jgi:dTDP-4-amino-4,6-dideoxygalactose transaminase
MILCGNPAAGYQARRAEIDAVVRRVFASGRYILGEEVSSFEQEFAEYLEIPFAIGLGNGTDAIYLALRACGIGAGDEVITVSHTASATAAAIVLSGATPVFVDIDPNYYTIDPKRLPAALTKKTKAIIPVHLYGQAAAMKPLLDFACEHDLRVIEDCAQSTGGEYGDAKLGTLGDIGCFSFYPTKNLGAFGDGGMAVTRDISLAERLRCLRQYGWDQAGESRVIGVNSRLDELQAAILRVGLSYLDADNAKRAEIALRYDSALQNIGVQLPLQRIASRHVFHLYVVRHGQRNELLNHLQANSVGALVHYAVPVHLQPAYQRYAALPSEMVETERVVGEIVSLPIYPQLSVAKQDRVIDAVKTFEEERHD